MGDCVTFFPFSLERLPGGGGIQAVWSRPSPLPLAWPLPSAHTHMAASLEASMLGSGQMHMWWLPFPDVPRAALYQ